MGAALDSVAAVIVGVVEEAHITLTIYRVMGLTPRQHIEHCSLTMSSRERVWVKGQEGAWGLTRLRGAGVSWFKV